MPISLGSVNRNFTFFRCVADTNDTQVLLRKFIETVVFVQSLAGVWAAVIVYDVSNGIHAAFIDHVAIIVTDLDRSKQFYGSVLGLQEVPRPESFDFPGAWYQMGETFLHLLGKPARDTESPRHFCLRVPDLKQAAEHLESVRWPVRWEARHKIMGIDRFFLYDPDGNRIEIQGPELRT